MTRVPIQKPLKDVSEIERDHDAWLRGQRKVWNKRAKDFTSANWVRKQDFINLFVEFAAPHEAYRVLDVGTGPGVIAAVMSPLVRQVVGLDMSDEMIKQAKDNHSDKSNVSFLLGDVQAMQFAADSFDLVMARMVFHHVDDCPLGFAEVFRTLTPGGTFVLCEGVPPDHVTRAHYERIFALKEKRHTFSEAELINMFDRAGFQDVLLKPHFMRHVSLNNWLEGGGLDTYTIDEIRRLHVEADSHFKNIYNLVEHDGDVFMDWKFAIIRGRKPLDGD